MWYLYGTKTDGTKRLVAMFSSEPQLLAYVQWATLRRNPDGTLHFEQKTPLTGFNGYDYAPAGVGDEPPDVLFNPTPGML